MEMDRLTKVFAIASLVLLLLVAGCQTPTPPIQNSNKAQITSAWLGKTFIKNDETTILTVDAKNTGDNTINVKLGIIPENETKIMTSYDGSLEFKLQPQETIGEKKIEVTGLTEFTNTTYSIIVQLVNKADMTILDSKTLFITVGK